MIIFLGLLLLVGWLVCPYLFFVLCNITFSYWLLFKLHLHVSSSLDLFYFFALSFLFFLSFFTYFEATEAHSWRRRRRWGRCSCAFTIVIIIVIVADVAIAIGNCCCWKGHVNSHVVVVFVFVVAPHRWIYLRINLFE